jgi:hypothetical protein
MPTIQQLIREAPPPAGKAEQSAGHAGLPAEAQRVHARLYDHAEEAELGSAQGRACG